MAETEKKQDWLGFFVEFVKSLPFGSVLAGPAQRLRDQAKSAKKDTALDEKLDRIEAHLESLLAAKSEFTPQLLADIFEMLFFDT